MSELTEQQEARIREIVREELPMLDARGALMRRHHLVGRDGPEMIGRGKTDATEALTANCDASAMREFLYGSDVPSSRHVMVGFTTDQEARIGEMIAAALESAIPAAMDAAVAEPEYQQVLDQMKTERDYYGNED